MVMHATVAEQTDQQPWEAIESVALMAWCSPRIFLLSSGAYTCTTLHSRVSSLPHHCQCGARAERLEVSAIGGTRPTAVIQVVATVTDVLEI
jgi:hypothetical protein